MNECKNTKNVNIFKNFNLSMSIFKFKCFKKFKNQKYSLKCTNYLILPIQNVVIKFLKSYLVDLNIPLDYNKCFKHKVKLYYCLVCFIVCF